MDNKKRATASWVINLIILVLNSLATILNPSTHDIAMGMFNSFIG